MAFKQKSILKSYCLGKSFNILYSFKYLINIYRGSEFFETMLKSNSMFIEKREGKVALQASTVSVKQFVRILYGLGVEVDEVSLEDVKELIKIGGIYDKTVQEVAGEYLLRFITKQNVFALKLLLMFALSVCNCGGGHGFHEEA